MMNKTFNKNLEINRIELIPLSLELLERIELKGDSMRKNKSL